MKYKKIGGIRTIKRPFKGQMYGAGALGRSSGNKRKNTI